MKKLTIPQKMKLAFNENAYWNKDINLTYLKWLRAELSELGHKEVLCVFDSFTGQVLSTNCVIICVPFCAPDH